MGKFSLNGGARHKKPAVKRVDCLTGWEPINYLEGARQQDSEEIIRVINPCVNTPPPVLIAIALYLGGAASMRIDIVVDPLPEPPLPREQGYIGNLITNIKVHGSSENTFGLMLRKRPVKRVIWFLFGELRCQQ
jgi:hypothetical protein